MTKPPETLDRLSLQQRLTPLQYTVTQQCGTEPPFRNAYWDTKADGIYVDIVSGEPLFSSQDKFDSGTGWPSFTRPLSKERLKEKEDITHGMSRIEVRSTASDSHLGHVFPDGPGPDGLRYCINSAALRFIPVDQLEAQGYGEYKALFGPSATTSHREIATLAGGCFWGVEELLRKLPGIIETTVGYTGGTFPNPTYEDVCEGDTGHAEAVQLIYDPSKISYEDILSYFFRLHDPTTINRQENDIGNQYRSAIFYHTNAQQDAAQKIKADLQRSGKWKRPIVTEIVPATPFYPAEAYHQDYLQKNPEGYMCHYLRD